MRACLGGSDVPARLTRRANQALHGVREDLWWAEDGSTAVVSDARGNQRWWTFAGLRANAELTDRLEDLSQGTRAFDNLSIGLADGVTGTSLKVALQVVSETQRVSARDYTARELPKFAECLPPNLASATIAIRYADAESIKACLDEPVRIVARV